MGVKKAILISLVLIITILIPSVLGQIFKDAARVQGMHPTLFSDSITTAMAGSSIISINDPQILFNAAGPIGTSWLINTSGNTLQFKRGATATALTIDGFNGRVGIGTTTPAFPIDVLSSSNAVIRVRSNSAPNSAIIQTDASGIVGFLRSSVSPNTVQIGSSSNHGVSIMTNNAERIAISNTGNVGIGTAPTANRLQVLGTTGLQNTQISGNLGVNGNVDVSNNVRVAGYVRLGSASGIPNEEGRLVYDTALQSMLLSVYDAKEDKYKYVVVGNSSNNNTIIINDTIGGGLTGGQADRLMKWTSPTTPGISLIQDDGSTVTIPNGNLVISTPVTFQFSGRSLHESSESCILEPQNFVCSLQTPIMSCDSGDPLNRNCDPLIAYPASSCSGDTCYENYKIIDTDGCSKGVFGTVTCASDAYVRTVGSGGNLNVEGGDVLFTGNLKVDKTLTLQNGQLTSESGTLNINGDVSATGDITATGKITIGSFITVGSGANLKDTFVNGDLDVIGSAKATIHEEPILTAVWNRGNSGKTCNDVCTTVDTSWGCLGSKNDGNEWDSCGNLPPGGGEYCICMAT